MSTVILSALSMQDSHKSNSEEIETAVKAGLKEVIPESPDQISLFQLDRMVIKPCNSCGACAFKSPGRCVVTDDMHSVMAAIAPAAYLVLVTEVRFGGYSATLKKAVDKFALLALPGYTNYRGKMVHPARYGRKSLLGIGIAEKLLGNQAASFERMVAHNAHNLQADHAAVILPPNEPAEQITRRVQAAVKGGMTP